MNRRTVREYENRKVEKEKIDKIIQGALTAPSGRNLKPIEIIIVEDEEKLIQLGKSRGAFSKWISSAPLGFVILADASESTTWISDAAITSIIIQLLGEDLGLSSCWIHGENRVADDGTDMEDNIRKILNIPGNYRINSMISMGYKKDKLEERTIDELDFTKVHYNCF